MTEEENEIPAELLAMAQIARENSLPKRSLAKYDSTYRNFISWQQEKRAVGMFDEPVLLAYFVHLQTKNQAPNTLMTIYSMLKRMLNFHHNIKIENYSNLLKFLERNLKGYEPEQAKVLTEQQISDFIFKAPDIPYLAHKVIFIFGILGALRCDEIQNVKVHDVELHNDIFVVKIPKNNEKTYKAKSFTISEPYFNIVDKYRKLRPPNCPHNRFFVNFQKGKCTTQAVGKNKISGTPKTAALFLGLVLPEEADPVEDADDSNIPKKKKKGYTGHALRRSSATTLSNSGADISRLQSHGGWQNPKVAQHYVEQNIYYKQQTEKMLTSNIPAPKKKPTSTVVREEQLNSSTLPIQKEYHSSPVKMSALKPNPYVLKIRNGVEQHSNNIRTDEIPHSKNALTDHIYCNQNIPITANPEHDDSEHDDSVKQTEKPKDNINQPKKKVRFIPDFTVDIEFPDQEDEPPRHNEEALPNNIMSSNKNQPSALSKPPHEKNIATEHHHEDIETPNNPPLSVLKDSLNNPSDLSKTFQNRNVQTQNNVAMQASLPILNFHNCSNIHFHFYKSNGET